MDHVNELIEAQQKALNESAKQLAEMAAKLPKEGEFRKYSEKYKGGKNRYCTVCGSYLTDEEFENHTIRYCYWCGSKVKGATDERD